MLSPCRSLLHGPTLRPTVLARRLGPPTSRPTRCQATLSFPPRRNLSSHTSHDSSAREASSKSANIILGKEYAVDGWTNVTPRILSHLNANLHLQRFHPLSLIRQRIADHFHAYRSPGKAGGGNSPLFSVHDRLSPVVTLEQNFDSLAVPKDHVSRKKSDSYYLNEGCMLRAHTTAHQADLIRMGLDNFLVIGDVYRRDEIDASHYPVFHQVDGVRLMDKATLTDLWRRRQKSPDEKDAFEVFEKGENRQQQQSDYKQGCHTMDAAKLVEIDLKECLVDLGKELFGKDMEYRWVDAQFPFTHPSWELEILHESKWMEVLGSGIIKQSLLDRSGAGDKIGWAFGMGLERMAMRLFKIPDIRLFWCRDPGFLNQFVTDDPKANIVFKPFSKYPPCSNDLSFWLPDDSYSSNDFYDLVRSVGGDLVEQVELIDDFEHPKQKKRSHCYRIVYRSMERTLLQEEVNEIHSRIEKEAVRCLKVTIR